MSDMSDKDRIAALEADLAALRKAVSEYIDHPCHMNWGGASCLEHGKADDECLAYWSMKP